MMLSYTTFLVIALAAFVVFHCTIADLQVNGPPKVGFDSKISVTSKVNDNDQVNNKKVETVKKTDDIDLKKDDLSEHLDPKNEPKKVDDGDSRDGQIDNKGLDSKSEDGSKIVRLPLPRDMCDSSSNSCTDVDKTLIACLRVPGDDSLDLSLLIHNQGERPVTVSISSPDFVHLEEKQLQIPEKQYSEVRVSIKSVRSSDFIILNAGSGNCSLGFKDQIFRTNIESTPQFSYIKHLKQTTSIGFMFLSALAVLSVWTCIKFIWKHFARNPKYQKVEMELPVSRGSKLESGSKEGWDDSWGDSWDEEEASPLSLPVTPTVSAKGFASRRLSKEGWKD